MDPIVISVVSALAAGALAAAKGVATDAVKDAYAALKHVIVDRYKHAGPFVEAVEADPSSGDEQRVLAKKLAGAESSPELRQAATALLAAVEQLSTQPEAAAVFDFGKFKALKTFEVEDVEYFGTLFRAQEAVFEGDAKFKGLRLDGGDRKGK